MQNGAASGGQASGGKAPDETAALDAITKISDAQTNYFRRNRRYALTFDELIDAHLLNTTPTAAQTGYDFSLRPSADAQTYKLSVNPTTPAPTARHFFSDESGTVRAETGKDASGDSPKI
jgi:type II secretory pathway pseudopilin PulG